MVEKNKMTIKEWIPKHKFLWIIILFGVGVALGSFQGILLSMEIDQMIKISLLYACLLPIVEITVGGSGLP